MTNPQTIGKIQDMKNMTWPMAVVTGLALLVIGVTALMEKDVSAVSSAMLFLLVALGYAELREIKSNTNGNNNSLMEQNRALIEELGEYRRNAARITDRALESQPLPPEQQPRP